MNINIDRIKERIEMAENRESVFRRKSEEYNNYCISEYNKIIESGNCEDWTDIMGKIENSAKIKFEPELAKRLGLL
jgi:hypothetical protein